MLASTRLFGVEFHLGDQLVDAVELDHPPQFAVELDADTAAIEVLVPVQNVRLYASLLTIKGRIRSNRYRGCPKGHRIFDLAPLVQETGPPGIHPVGRNGCKAIE